MTKVKLLSVQEAVAAAAKVRARYAECEAGGLDPRRALDGVSVAALLSLAVLAGQYDRLARTAAPFSLTPQDFALFEALQAQLLAAGYLPLPPSPPKPQQKEPAHGEG